MASRLAKPSTSTVVRRWIVLILFIIVCIAGGVGLFLWLHSDQSTSQASALVQEVSAEPSQTETEISQEVALTPGDYSFDLSAYTGEVLPVDVDLPYVTPTSVPATMADYQNFHPEMCCEYPAEFVDSEVPAVYFTFDDGPSTVTDSILNTLQTKDAKATFFIMGNTLSDPLNQARLKRMVEEGHTLGIHTQTHQYTTVYSSVGAFLADFYAVWNTVYEITGVKGTIFRFPGGSINSYNRHIYKAIIEEMTRRGFVYYDWNVSAEDAVSTPATVESILYSATLHGWRERPVVLMHDSIFKTVTAQALGDVIDVYYEVGYTPMALTNLIKPMQF